MLNKLQFNNLVITNKKQIQQIKAQTIQKLVQKIRKLKSLLEKRPEDEKTKSRLRKATESMEQLKNLKCVDIVKRVLLLEKNANAVITNGLATPEELAVALMAVHKSMQNLMQSFREQLGLKEGDETWKRELQRMSKRRFKIMRTEQKRQKRKELKEQKVLAHKREEWLKGNNPTGAEAGDSSAKGTRADIDDSEADAAEEEANISTTGIWKVVPIMEATKPKISGKRTPKQANVKTEANKVTQKVPVKQKTQAAVSIVPARTAQSKSVQDAVEPMEQLKKENEVAAPENHLREGDVVAEADTKSSETVTHVVDPFFITDSGENYRSTAVITRDSGPQPSEQAPQQHAKSKPVNGAAAAPQKRQRPTAERSYNRSERGQERPTKWQKAEAKSGSNNLHPSWAAKQKFKPVIAGFQGKKITFGDADVSVDPNKSVKHSAENAPTSAKKRKSNANEVPALHPSWAAKQKLKPNITTFQGKKVVFDDAATPSVSHTVPRATNKPQQATSSAAADLHPSWAAKQKLKPTIAAFQGKKISFDD